MAWSRMRVNRVAMFVVALVALLMLLSFVGGWMLLNTALMTSNSGREGYEASRHAMREEYPVLGGWLDSLQAEEALCDVYMEGGAGSLLHGVYICASEPTKRTAVVIHGYTDNAMRMLQIAYMYSHGLGYNVFLPDLYGHGLSQGNHAQMGWNDRLDILEWLPRVDSIFGGGSKIVVHGISMGAATAMLVAGEATPDYVKCFVEDCGYTSAWDEFKYKLREEFGLPDFPLLYTANIVCHWRYGWDFVQASPLRAMGRVEKPMLFVHGDNDHYVPTWMVYPLYEACAAPKALFVAKGSKHTYAYHDYPVEYTRVVEAFVGKYMAE